MNSHRLVRPEHLNHYGFLFGGTLLKWVDEQSWIAASLDFPGKIFVTIGLDNVEFHKSVRQGAILRFDIHRSKLGNTSVSYQTTVYSDDITTGQEEAIFSTSVTFVHVDDQGNKTPIKQQ